MNKTCTSRSVKILKPLTLADGVILENAVILEIKWSIEIKGIGSAAELKILVPKQIVEIKGFEQGQTERIRNLEIDPVVNVNFKLSVGVNEPLAPSHVEEIKGEICYIVF